MKIRKEVQGSNLARVKARERNGAYNMCTIIILSTKYSKYL